MKLQKLIGKICYYPIRQMLRVNGEQKRLTVAWVRVKIVSAKEQFGRIDVIAQVLDGTGSVETQFDLLKDSIN